MIKKLKFKFIILSMTSLFILLLVIVTGMNAINYTSVINEADDILSLLSVNKGDFPPMEGIGDRLPPHMSPEIPFESRYFSVLLTDSGKIIHTETSKITAVDSARAASYAEKAVAKSENSGFLGNFRYLKHSENGEIRITFLDCGRRLDTFRSFLVTSCLISFLGLIIVFIVIFFLSEKIIRPISESYEKQKRFITDAGHEIKTPLTIINANADILEMETGENESLTEIKNQAKRLTSLTNDLVSLARMEETENKIHMIEFPVSEVVKDTATPFSALTGDREFILNIQPMLSLKGNAKALEQLTSILLDNAIKYSPADGKIVLELTRQNKSIILSVFNTSEKLNKENLSLVFDRFYRIDSSRNSETGGHGIGLSLAKAIVSSHSGKITATSPNENSFKITAVFPN